MSLQFPPILALYSLGMLGAFFVAYQSWVARPARGALLWSLVTF